MKKISIILAVLATLAFVGVAVASSDYWATSVEDYWQGPPITGTSISSGRSNPLAVLGAPDNDGTSETQFFSLGDEGYVVVKLAEPVRESLEIYEATYNCDAGYANEQAIVSVSPDGVNWTEIGIADNKEDKTCYNGSGFISEFPLTECIQYVKVQDAGTATTLDGFDVDAIGGTGLCMEVDIDIKPGSDPNAFNINDHGVIPVAILGSMDFDVDDIDTSTVTFAGLEVRVKGKGPKCAPEDVNNDGYMDLVCQFEDDVSTWDPGEGIATLEGYLYDGTYFYGSDTIKVVPE